MEEITVHSRDQQWHKSGNQIQCIFNWRIKLHTKYESVSHKILFGNGVFTVLMFGRKYVSSVFRKQFCIAVSGLRIIRFENPRPKFRIIL
jgi:hypothetical protein